MAGMAGNALSELDQLNRTFRPALVAFFLRRLRNHAEAEDMAQDVFIRLARAERVDVHSTEAYIFQIAVNLLRDRARREKHRSDYRGDLAADDEFGVDCLDPSRIIAGEQSLAALTNALGDLPQLTRAIFICHRLENITRPQIAEAYQLSESSVDRHLAKALAFLITRLRELK
jgi:RNA polymerase sigma factor (sigma-70 family)